MLNTVFNTPFFDRLKREFDHHPSLLLEQLWDCPKALIIHYLKEHYQTDILVISGGDRESKLITDLAGIGEKAWEFPAWEALPGDDISPSLDIVGERLSQLIAYKAPSPHIVVAPLQAVLQKVPHFDAIFSHLLSFRVGQEIPFNTIGNRLIDLGYKEVSLVEDKGQFAIRGGLIDLFPASAFNPYRLDFFGNTIEAIKFFDPVSQRSIGNIEAIDIHPSNELFLVESMPSYLLDHLKKETLVVFDDLLKIEDRYVEIKSLPGAKSPLFSRLEDFIQRSSQHRCLYFSTQSVEKLQEDRPTQRLGRQYYSQSSLVDSLSLSICNLEISTHRLSHPFTPLVDFLDIDADTLEAHQIKFLERLKLIPEDFECHLFSATAQEEKIFKEHLDKTSLPSQTFFHIGYLSSGFVHTASKILFFPYSEFSKRQRIVRKKWRNTYHFNPVEFHHLEPGSFVVHLHNGIGKFVGIEKQRNHLGIDVEFMVISYAEGARLFVPMSQAHLVSRYIGTTQSTPDLSAIGTKKWQQAKIKAQKAIIGYAKELLQSQAKRQLKGGFVYPEDSTEMKLFEEEFPYEETEDQLRAIASIKADMLADSTMDRLVCGDVGYGKTEVAMRAAFKAAIDGKRQVAVLAPTTILAMQHYETFKNRMENFSVSVDLVCRFKTPKENKATLERVSRGEVNILIGTHRILSQDVHFPNLGLLIVDEEQRFGVRAKEKLKNLKEQIDCLTMTATPIPRTLYFSLLNIRALSVIASPPQDRLPIKTIICDREDQVIEHAILRELARDGQVYFIHNRVESIYQAATFLEKLVPHAKIGVVHGQMDSDSIEDVFVRFKRGDLDVLLATSIVENGIDIPNANTILIDRAHHFGVSDLYQLRGRVGRWNRAAYAYFLTPKFRELPEISQKRLQALVESSGHGGGMKLAMMDLELRGAGDILGTEQSGQVSTVGFHLYCKLLKKTIEALQEGKSTDFFETKMEFKFNGQIPEYYVEDSTLRLDFYHRFGDASTTDEIDTLLKEMEDRFGKAPEELRWLYHLTRIKVFCMTHRISSIKFDRMTTSIERETPKGIEKKTFFMPQPINGLELELITLKRLREELHLT